MLTRAQIDEYNEIGAIVVSGRPDAGRGADACATSPMNSSSAPVA